MKKILLLNLFFALHFPLFSQSAWLVFLTDKPEWNAPLEDFLDPKAVERRLALGYSEPLHSDAPLDERYLTEISALSQSLRHELRWFNAISIEADQDQISAIRELNYVKEIRPIGEFVMAETELPVHEAFISSIAGNAERDKVVFKLQREMLNSDTLRAAGLDGSGVRIAVFDAGFKGADKHLGLIHLWAGKQIIETRNFFKPGHTVFGHSGHGTMVLGCIAGRMGEDWIGSASGAEFLLARTEHVLGERIVEEDHWLAAMEWAEKKGADIISSSLGYSGRRYDYRAMDGKTTIVTRAGQLAARLGVLVVNSAGNDGDSKFKYICAPADGDSVLAVGGTMPQVKAHIKFSSFGPSSDGGMKPNISAPGYVYTTMKDGGFGSAPGTSFSCPLISGIAACAMQRYPDKSNMDIFQLLEEIGHLYPYYDYAHGYGIPDASRLLVEKAEVKPSFRVRREAEEIILDFDKSVLNANRKRMQNGLPLLFHIEDEEGRLKGYRIEFVMENTLKYVLPNKMLEMGILRIWFEGYMAEVRAR